MRLFLIIFSFVNAFLYYLVYAFYDNILGIISASGAFGFFAFLKLLVLIVVGFLIGLIVSLMTRVQVEKTFFDYRIAIVAGIIPFILLILSTGIVTDFIVSGIFNSNRQVSEFVFYFLSRQIIWTLWLGFALGASVRVSFKKKLKHEAYFKMEDNLKIPS
jgi:hypothetical protein